MDLWSRPWKSFPPLAKEKQFIPLLGTIPPLWQAVFVVTLFILLIVYYLFLVIDINPWRRPHRKATVKKRSSRSGGRQSALNRRRRKHHRQC